MNEQGGMKPNSVAVPEWLVRLGEKRKDGSHLFTSGITGMDQCLGRLRRGTLNIVASRPSMGKTAFLLHMAMQQAKQGIKTYFFSLETNVDDLLNRCAAIELPIPLMDITEGKITDEQMAQVEALAPDFIELPVLWSESTDIKRILKEALGGIEKGSRSCIFLDYIQLVGLSGFDHTDQYHIVSMVVRELKKAAMGIGVPIIAAAQLNRAVEQRKDKTPVLSDLADSGELEKTADILLALNRPGFYDLTRHDEVMQVVCLKNRTGPRVNFQLGWDGERSRIYEED